MGHTVRTPFWNCRSVPGKDLDSSYCALCTSIPKCRTIYAAPLQVSTKQNELTGWEQLATRHGGPWPGARVSRPDMPCEIYPWKRLESSERASARRRAAGWLDGEVRNKSTVTESSADHEVHNPAHGLTRPISFHCYS